MKILFAILLALDISFIILRVWEKLEMKQFGELQKNRKCDSAVWWLYLIALIIAFAL